MDQQQLLAIFNGGGPDAGGEAGGEAPASEGDEVGGEFDNQEEPQ